MKWCKLARGFKAKRCKINGRKTKAECIRKWDMDITEKRT